MIAAIIFDLDGTLLDTLGDLHAATNHVLRQFGYPERSAQEVCRFVGNGAARLIEQAVPEGADPAPVLAAFQSYYATHCNIQTKPYEGIPEALAVLGQRYPLAVVSNKPDQAVKELVKAHFPGLYARGETADCPRKPEPDMVHMTMDDLGAMCAIYVGDSNVDIITAQNAGLPSISVTWGFRREEELMTGGAHYFCHSPADLPELVQKVMRWQYGL